MVEFTALNVKITRKFEDTFIFVRSPYDCRSYLSTDDAKQRFMTVDVFVLSFVIVLQLSAGLLTSLILD